jgi:ELWxxDGT repeat protein
MISSRSPRSAALLAALATAMILGAAAAIAAPGDIQFNRIDVVPGSGSSSPSDLASIGNTVFFRADDGVNGEELWKSDGTTATRIDVFPGPNSSFPAEMTNVDGTLFFRASDTLNQGDLFKLEPPYTTPTKIVVNPGGGSGAERLANFNGTLYFAATDGTTAGRELWKSNGGTVASGGTTMVADINTASGESSFPEQLTPVGSTLFFVASDGNDGGADGEELWKTDGTVGNATELEINAAADEGSDPFELTDVGGTLFLVAENGTVGRELFKAAQSDLAATPINIAPGMASSDPEDFGALGSTVFFNANDGSGAGVELWKSDGGPVGSGTAMVDDINPSGDSFPEEMIAFNGEIYFLADGGDGAGSELWKSNGGPVGAGTQRVADINPGSANSNPSDPVVFDGRLWFRASTTAAGNELWNFDGAAVHTADIAPGAPASTPIEFTPATNALFFVANDGGFVNQELWKATVEPAPPPSVGGGGATIVPASPALPKKKKCKKKKNRAAAAKKKCKKKRK